jgi:hypothetical protein
MFTIPQGEAIVAAFGAGRLARGQRHPIISH